MGHRRTPTWMRATVAVLAAAVLTSGCVGTSLPSPRTAVVACSVDPALVNITTTFAYDTTNGNRATGIVIGTTGEVLTNNHVVAGAGTIEAIGVSDGRTYSASVVGTDITHDLAVLKLHAASALRTADLGDSATVAVGQRVYAIGNAHGNCGTPSITSGKVVALNTTTVAGHALNGESLALTGLIQSDAPLTNGVSGGPLVNADAEVIGVLAAGYRDAGTYRGFAIPINLAAAVARQILAGRSSADIHVGPAASLGVETVVSSGEPPGAASSAAVVARVIAGSPADRLGLVPGCTIVGLGGRTIASARDLLESLHARSPGEVVQLTWRDRHGTSHAASVRLVTGPPL